MSLAFIDCEFPKDHEEAINAEGHREWGCTYLSSYPPHNH